MLLLKNIFCSTKKKNKINKNKSKQYLTYSFG